MNTKRNAATIAAITGAATLATAFAAAPGAALAQSGINVTVNGSPVNFTGQGPVEQGGRVLVPLRGVLEKLGAYVTYDASARRITAVRGQTSIELPIGGNTATVGGRSVSLDAPAQVYNGSTLVPLRFVAEALGERVVYEPSSRTVAVASNAGGTSTSSSSAQPPFDSGTPGRRGANRVTTTITGSIISADPEGRSITMRDAETGGRRAYVLTNNARLRARNGNAMELDALRAGDEVTVTLNQNGRATGVEMDRRGARGTRNNGNAPATNDGRIRGTLKSISGTDGPRYTITMENGISVGVADTARVLFRGSIASRSDLRAGDRIAVTTDAEGLGVAVEILDRLP